MVVADEAGTTRDSIDIDFHAQNQDFTLIDTAGMRRRCSNIQYHEKISIQQSIKAIERADVVVCMVDGSNQITNQDTRLVHLAVARYRPVIIAINKTDLLSVQKYKKLISEYERIFHFAHFMPRVDISVIQRKGVSSLLRKVQTLYRQANYQEKTATLNNWLEKAVSQNPPPMVFGRRVKIRYIHQTDTNPPKFKLFGNQLNKLPKNYLLYLAGALRKNHWQNIAFKISLHTTENPFSERKNKLSNRQVKKRKRLKDFIKKNRKS